MSRLPDEFERLESTAERDGEKMNTGDTDSICKGCNAKRKIISESGLELQRIAAVAHSWGEKIEIQEETMAQLRMQLEQLVLHDAKMMAERDEYDTRRREAMESSNAWRERCFGLEKELTELAERMGSGQK